MAKKTQSTKKGSKAAVDNTDDIVIDDAGSLDKEMKALEKKPFINLLAQIDSEYTLSERFMRPKWSEWAVRLKLYNNQKRDKAAVGDPLLFTIHQTVLASLYDDKLMATFSPRERGDQATAENLTSMAEFDYDDMEKDELDYYWDWDATFFGRGLVLLMEFDREMKCPIGINIDPFTFFRDPKATSVNGNKKGLGALRFWGYEIRMTKNQMREAGVYFNLDKLGKADNDYSSIIDQNIALRNEAQGRETSDDKFTLKGENQEYRILRWFTHYQGKKVLVETANGRKTVVRYYELPSNKKWPLIDRACFPMSKDWDGVSIPDLAEDKQRARSVAQNLALKGVKANLHPKYLFNVQKIKKTYLQREEVSKHIPVDGDPNNAIVPVQQKQVNAEVNWILGVLDNAAQRSTATPEIMSGQVSAEKRTATEIEKVSRGSDTRYSLAAKIFGWSEKRFWQQWYFLYKEYFADKIDEKIIRINGAGTSRWRKLLKDNIVANIDPDVSVESKILADAKRQVKLQGFTNFTNIALSYPTSNKLFAIRQLGTLNGVDKDIIDTVIPPTVDEMDAEEENINLENNVPEQVEATDDHLVHIEIHREAAETPAKYAHIQAHKKALAIKKVRPDLFPQVPSEQMPSNDVMSKISSAPNESPVARSLAPNG